MSVLNKYKLKLNIDKCKFAYKKIMFMGFIVDGFSKGLEKLKIEQLERLSEFM